LISSITNDPTSGAATFIGNNASIHGQGWDIILNSTNLVKKVRWSTQVLFSYIKDKVTSLQVIPTTNLLLTNGSQIGKPLYGIYSYPWAGLDAANGDPLGYIDNLSSKDYSYFVTRMQPNELRYNGPANPTLFGSIRNNFSWKNFEVSANITYKGEYYFRRSSVDYSGFLISFGGHSDYALRWQKPGDEKNTSVPSFPANINGFRDIFYLNSSALVEKGDHIRLQDIRLSYNLDKQIIKTIPFQNVQFYLYVNNLGILWRANNQKIDPDYGASTPNPRSILLGLNVVL
jgi:hypothetical protein